MLASAQIPYQIIEDAASCALVVPAGHSPRAADELRLYDEENPPRAPVKPIHFEHQHVPATGSAPGASTVRYCAPVNGGAP